MGFAHNLVQDTEHSLFHDDAVVCDSLTVPGRQVLGVKAMIGALAAPTAMSSNHWSIQIVAGAVTAVCAFEVATDALATQVRISVEKESLLNQINTIS